MNSRTGSGMLPAFLTILLIASVALNMAFLTGCFGQEGLRGGFKESRPTSQQRPRVSTSEATYLREIASVIGLSPSSDKTPGDIAFDIEQTLNNYCTYSGTIFSDEAFEECKSAIPTTKDTETFEGYHAFIKKIAGKKIVILNN